MQTRQSSIFDISHSNTCSKKRMSFHAMGQWDVIVQNYHTY